MARVKGPLFSLSASGTYLKQFVFRTRSTGTHVATRPATLPARSAAQNAHAQKVADMAAAWRHLAPATQAEWSACALSFGLTGYTLYWREWIAQASTPASPPTNPCP